MQVIVVILFSFLCLNIQAQNCPKYDTAMTRGKYFLQRANYDSALVQFQVAQIAARECKMTTNEPADSLKNVFKGIQDQRDNAVKQKDFAVKATKEAFLEKERANAAQLRTEAQKEAFRLIIIAGQKVTENPTKALRIAEAAIAKYDDTLILKEADKIYEENTFYKTIGDQSSDFSSYGSPSLKISPDGTHFLTCSRDSTAKLWDMKGHLSKKFKGHNEQVLDATFSPDGTKVLTGSDDSTAILWNMNGDPLKRFSGHMGAVRCVAFSPDGNKIVTGSDDSTCRIWNTNDTKQIKFSCPSYISYVAFSPDQRQVLTYSNDRVVRLWNLSDSSVKEFGNSSDEITSVVFSPDGKNIVTGSVTGIIKIWDIESDNVNELKGHTGYISSLIFSPGGRQFISTSTDNTAKLWGFDSWNRTCILLKEFKGDMGQVDCAAFVPDASKMLSYSSVKENQNNGPEMKVIRLWSLSGSLTRDLHSESGITSAVLSNDGNNVLSAGEDSTLTLWNLIKASDKKIIKYNVEINSVAFSPDSRNDVLTASSDSTIRISSINSEPIKIFKQDFGITAAAFSPDGKKIFIGFEDKPMAWLNVKDGGTKEFDGDDRPPTSIAVSGDGTKIISCYRGGTVFLWNMDGKLIRKFLGFSAQDGCGAISPDGTKILIGYNNVHNLDKSVNLWGIDSTLIWKIKGDNFVTSVAFSPDSKKILAGYSDGVVRLLSLQGNLLAVYDGVNAAVISTTFSVDGTKILVAYENGLIKLYNNRMIREEFIKKGELDELTKDEKEKFGIK